MFRRLVLAATGAALAVGLAGVPTTAASHATVFDVQGMPGVKLDVCDDGDEVISKFRYGKVLWSDTVPAGPSRIKVFEANDRKTCRGKKLIDQVIDLAADGNYTLVYWLKKGNPTLNVFTNDVTVPTDQADVTFRHVAQGAKVDFWLAQVVKPSDLGPTASGIKKGEEFGPIGVARRTTLFEVTPTRPTPRGPWVGVWYDVELGEAIQVVLIGDRQRNYKLRVIWQPGIAP